ncbi:MAG: hypothetical protein WKF34_06165 [Pyrinomonadaceae bacterium]
MINGLISIVCLVAAGFCFYTYGRTPPDANTIYLVGTIVFGLLMVVFGVMFLSGRVNKSEDIHITE